MRTYVNKILSNIKENAKLSELASNLDDAELFDFIGDIISEKFNEYNIVFSGYRGVTPDEMAFEWLRTVSSETFKRIYPILEKLFYNAIYSPASNNESLLVIENILSLSARRKEGLRKEFIKDMITDEIHLENISNEHKIDLAILLTQLKNPIYIQFWEEETNYSVNTYFGPAIISAYQYTDPAKGLKLISNINALDNEKEWYHAPVKTALETMLLNDNNYYEYIKIKNDAPLWLKSIINKSLDSYIFKQWRVVDDIESAKKGKKQIKIGISSYPDLLVIVLAKVLGKLNGHKSFFYTIGFTPWNEIFDGLIKEKFDYIIANRTVCDQKNQTENYYYYIKDLDGYKGFYILTHDDNNIVPYISFYEKYKEPVKALHETLRQFQSRPLKVFASENTDHYEAFVSLLTKANIDMSNITIVSDSNPQEGFLKFIGKETDCYVGGLPQRIKGKTFGKVELLSQSDCKILNYMEVNGLVCLSKNKVKLDGTQDVIISSWFDTINELNGKQGDEHLKTIAYFLNQNNATDNGEFDTLLDITEGELKKWWEVYQYHDISDREKEKVNRKEVEQALARVS